MRISREQMFMDMCDVIAKRSTCNRGNVGAIIASGKYLLTLGYNGAPEGEPHCNETNCHPDFGPCTRTLHAEYNAIRNLADYYVGQTQFELYCSMSPCSVCAHVICLRKDIKKIYFRQAYRDSSGINYLKENGRLVYQIMPNGEIIDLN